MLCPRIVLIEQFTRETRERCRWGLQTYGISVIEGSCSSGTSVWVCIALVCCALFKFSHTTGSLHAAVSESCAFVVCSELRQAGKFVFHCWCRFLCVPVRSCEDPSKTICTYRSPLPERPSLSVLRLLNADLQAPHADTQACTCFLLACPTRGKTKDEQEMSDVAGDDRQQVFYSGGYLDRSRFSNRNRQGCCNHPCAVSVTEAQLDWNSCEAPRPPYD